MGLTIRTGDLAAFMAASGPYFGASCRLSDLPDKAVELLIVRGGRDMNVFSIQRDGAPAGRIMVFADQSDPAGNSAASFANFGCADDPEVARTLLDIAAGWTRARGLIRLGGAVSLIGPGLMTAGTGPQLARLLAANGFAATRQLDSFWLDPRKAHPPAVSVAAQAILDNPAYHFAPQTPALQRQRLAEVKQILSAAAVSGNGFAGTLDLMDHHRTDPSICAVLHHDRQPVACCLGIPDLHPTLGPTLRTDRSGQGATIWDRLAQFGLTRPRSVVLFSAVVPQFQGLDIASLLLGRVMRALRTRGYSSVSTDPAADLGGLDTTQTGVSLQSRLQQFGKAV